MPSAPKATDRLRRLTPEQLAADQEATRLVARLIRKDAKEAEPVRVAAFSSYI